MSNNFRISGKVRLTIFMIILLIVSVICLVFEKRTVNNYTEEDTSLQERSEKGTVGEVEQSTASVVQNTVDNVEEPVVEKETEVETTTEQESTNKFSEQDYYYLAKIAMAEAEGEDLKGKALVICVVLNRVNSTRFPNTVKDVIFANNGKVYQFSPVKPGGRWYTTEPNEDCYKAVEMVQAGWDESNGALYFESCKNEDNWHSRNLTFLFKHGCHRFYKQ